MVAQSSLLAGIALVAGSSLAAAQSFASSDDFASFSDLSAATSSVVLSDSAASSTVSASASASASFSQITAAPSAGFSSPNAKNSTSTITNKPQTTISLFNACSGPDSSCKSLDDLTYFGSVVTADKSKTIYALDCSQTGKNGSTECFSHPMTVTQGPSMFARVDDSGAIPTTVSCDIKSKTESAVCSESYKATGAAATITASASLPKNSGNSTVTGNTFSFAESQIHYNALVITKGAEKLNGNGTVASKTPSAPASSLSAPSATRTSGAGALTAPVASFAGAAAIFFAVFAI